MVLPPLHNRWAVLTLLFMARLAIPVQFQSVPPLVPSLVEELGLDYGQVGMLVGLYMAPGVLLALPGGLLGARYGDRTVLAGSLALMAAGTLLFARAGSFPSPYAAALAGRLIAGSGAVVLNMYAMKVVTDHFAGLEIATAMGIMLAGWPLGMAGTVAAFGSVAAATSWQAAIDLTALYALVLLALVLLFLRPPASPPPQPPGAAPRPRGITVREALPVGVAGAVWGLYNASIVVYLGFTPTLLMERGTSVEVAGALTGLAMWAAAGFVPLGGWLADRTGKPHILIAVGCTAMAAMAAMAPYGGPVALWSVVYALALAAPAGAIMALPAGLLRPESRAVGFGIYFTVYYGALAALPPLAGHAQDVLHVPAVAVELAALLALAAPALLVPLRLLQRRWPAAGAVRPAERS